MEFRRVTGLPPYVFAQINGLKADARAHGRDVIDFGFGNPDLPSPDVAVEKLAEAARNPKNHRYSASRGIPNLRLAIATRYKELFDVDLDPETDVVTSIGAKEGFTHLMWVLLGPGDSAIVPSPSYPIHLAGPGFAGAQVITVPMLDPGASTNDPGEDFAEAAGHCRVLPAQPDECVRGPRLHGASRQFCPRTRSRDLSRLRLRRPRL
jgi:alanine-synthesizing transaminase